MYLEILVFEIGPFQWFSFSLWSTVTNCRETVDKIIHSINRVNFWSSFGLYNSAKGYFFDLINFFLYIQLPGPRTSDESSSLGWGHVLKTRSTLRHIDRLLFGCHWVFFILFYVKIEKQKMKICFNPAKQTFILSFLDFKDCNFPSYYYNSIFNIFIIFRMYFSDSDCQGNVCSFF